MKQVIKVVWVAQICVCVCEALLQNKFIKFFLSNRIMEKQIFVLRGKGNKID